MDAVREIVAGGGLTDFTIAQVARISGVHETSIYRRWGDRETLALDAFMESDAEGTHIPDTGSLREDLIGLLDGIVSKVETPFGAVMLRANVQGSANSRGRDLSYAYWTAQYERALPIFERAIARGELSPEVDTRRLLEVVLAPIYFRKVITGEDFTEGFTAEVVDGVLLGFNPA